jgi:sugar lactone lactonase YvrE
VSSYNNNKVVRYNGKTGALIGDFVASGLGGLSFPTGIIFGPDGNLYVASSFAKKVIRYNGTTGALIGDFAASGFATINQLAGLSFGTDGNLYVSGFGNPSTVARYNGTTGALIGDFVTSNLDGFWGMEFSPDGNLYVSSDNNNKILRYNGTTGTLIGDFVTSGLSGLDHPTYLTFGPPVIYVGQDGLCGGKRLCFTSIQNGIDSAQSFMIMEITQETYNEDIILDDPKVVTLQGGWDTNFTSSSSYTAINGSITITNGTMIIENIIVK